jgi:hypothetical protein
MLRQTDKHNLTRLPSQTSRGFVSDIPITWRDVAIWLDTEGSASIYRHHGRYESVVHIAQKEREPLQKLCDFVKSQGIRCKVRTAGKTNGMFVLEVRPIVSQAAFLASVRPLLMTRNKSESVDRVILFLKQRANTGRRRKGLISQIPSPISRAPVV